MSNARPRLAGLCCPLTYGMESAPGWVQTDMGGEGAPTPVETSVGGMLKVIDGLQASDNGRFLGWDGSQMPW